MTESETVSPPKGALTIIFFIAMMDLLGFGIIIPLLPLFAKDYHASPVEVGLLFSIYSACQFLASPILGMISDRYGRRPVLVFSQLGSVLGYALLGLVMMLHWNNAAWALLLIYVSRIIDGLSGGNISTAQAYISDVTTAETRAKGMGVLGAAFGVGFALGPAVASLLVGIHPALPGFAAAIFSFSAMTMTWLRLPESRAHKPAVVADWLHPRRFAPVFRHSRLVQLLSIAFISMAAFSMLEAMMALFLSDKHTFSFSDVKVGFYYTYLGFIIVVVQGGLIGRLTKKCGEWPLAISGAIFVAVGMGMLASAAIWPGLLILLLGGAVNAVGRSLQTPTLYALISQNSDPREQGLVFGLNQGLASVARIVGPAIASIVYTLWIGGPFAVAGLIVLIAGFWTIALRTKSDTDKFQLPPDAAAAESV